MVKHDDSPDMADSKVERRLLSLLEALVKEIRPDRSDDMRISLESRLDRDLGLDSLARSELLLRIEQEFGARLPESALLAETPATLLELLHSSTAESSHRVATEPLSPRREAASAEVADPGGELALGGGAGGAEEEPVLEQVGQASAVGRLVEVACAHCAHQAQLPGLGNLRRHDPQAAGQAAKGAATAGGQSRLQQDLLRIIGRHRLAHERQKTRDSWTLRGVSSPTALTSPSASRRAASIRWC